MPKNHESPGPRLLETWNRLSQIPGGRWIFSGLLGFTVPYTGALRARVRELSPGLARVQLRDRRRVRNHLNSVHAVALANLGEVTSGLAMLTGLPGGVRGIVRSLSVQYHKKARGTLTAVAEVEIPRVTEETEQLATAVITDPAGEQVATVSVAWNLRPRSDQ